MPGDVFHHLFKRFALKNEEENEKKRLEKSNEMKNARLLKFYQRYANSL